MRNRHRIGAVEEGGPRARPRFLPWRAMLATAVACLLVTATQGTAPQPEATAPQQEHVISDAGVRQIDWDSLPGSVVAWVEVPGTSIDEPVAQASPEDPDHFLYHDALGQGAYGTPYIDCECAADSPFVIVYGHHMSDGTAFADFAKFSDRAYAEAHGTVYVHTRADGRRHELSVVAADVVDASRESVRVKFASEEDRAAYVSQVVSSSDLLLDGDDLTSGRTWAFATCSYQTSDSRTVVYACEPAR